jgi:hypothetical protein
MSGGIARSKLGLTALFQRDESGALEMIVFESDYSIAGGPARYAE